MVEEHLNVSTYPAEGSERQGYVILAGAGVSMDAPACLPSWFGFNDLVVDALCTRVTGYLDHPGWLDQVREGVRFRRDTARVFPPDYQAQIIEEECGETYFHVLQSLDSPQGNFAHESIAALAAAGHVRAIVTTNFDRLIERALSARGVLFRSYYNAQHYEELRAVLEAGGDDPRGVPVIKVHGSVEEPSSMIDTRKQRLRGREAALLAVLNPLLRRHYWVYLGFSAADLACDPDYLGLRAAAAESPGFTFLMRPGSAPTEGAEILKNAYGCKGLFESALLAEWLRQWLTVLGLAVPEEPAIVAEEPGKLVREAIDAWAQTLDPFEAINITATLFEAAGEEGAAWQLLHRTWRSRIPSDCSGDHYSKYQLNYARLCLAAGELEYEETLQNLLRTSREVPQAGTPLASYWLWTGRTELFLKEMHWLVHAAKDSPEWSADTTLVALRYHEIFGFWKDGMDLADEAAASILTAGDQPRYARIMALATLLAARLNLQSDVERYFARGATVAAQLGEETIIGELHYGRGVFRLRSGAAAEAWEDLQKAHDHLAANHRWPLLAGVRIEMARAATDLGLGAEVDSLFRQVEQDLDRFPVWIPRFQMAAAEACMRAANIDAACGYLRDGLQYASELKNEFAERRIVQALERLRLPPGQ